MKYREGTDEPDCSAQVYDYSEQLHWSALLLYLMGDPADVPLM
jgi:hypothetical protein